MSKLLPIIALCLLVLAMSCSHEDDQETDVWVRVNNTGSLPIEYTHLSFGAPTWEQYEPVVVHDLYPGQQSDYQLLSSPSDCVSLSAVCMGDTLEEIAIDCIGSSPLPSGYYTVYLAVELFLPDSAKQLDWKLHSDGSAATTNNLRLLTIGAPEFFLDLDNGESTTQNLYDCCPDTMLGAYDIAVYYRQDSLSVHCLMSLTRVSSSIEELDAFPTDSVLVSNFDGVTVPVVFAVRTDQGNHAKFAVDSTDSGRRVYCRYYCREGGSLDLSTR